MPKEDTETPAEVPSDSENEGNRVYKWPELDVVALRPGDVIEGFEDLKDVDTFAYSLIDRDPNSVYVGPELAKKRGNLKPSEKILPKKFFGKAQNIRIVVLPLDPSFLKDDDPSWARDKSFTFLVAADLHSTGRGVIGTSSLECTVTRRLVQQSSVGGEKNSYWSSILHYNKQAMNVPQRIVDLLQEDSSDNAHKRLRYGLSHVFSGGIPGLGR